MAGQTLKIPATVTGRPTPTIEWAVEEGELDKDRVVIENVGTKSELTIKNALRKDHGRYVITATNSSGSKSAGTRVEVFGKKNIFRNQLRNSFGKIIFGLYPTCLILFFRCSWASP